MSDDFEAQWQMTARTENWKCPSCGQLFPKTHQMKRLTIAKERDTHLLITDGTAACPNCNQPIDLIAILNGQYDFKTTTEKREQAYGCGFLTALVGAIIAFVVVYQFYAWPFPLIAAGAAFATLFALAYHKFKPEGK